ncbi:MAG: hypothetical protein IKF90_15550 [Parasporobacterium sp.]|nr:hypothetical protein [Parasporobacterium sp.]
MTDGYYSKLSQRIKEISDQNILVISVKTLADYIDISEMDPDEKDRRLKQAMASVALYQNGFRSVERGSGYFLDYRNCDNPIYLQKLCENADIDAKTKGVVLKALEEIKQKNIDTLPEYAQFVFDFDDDGNSSYIEEITKDQLIEMLKKDAEAVQ